MRSGTERLRPGDPRLGAVLDLIRDAFGFMEGRIAPPSSMHRLSRADIDRQAGEGEVWISPDAAAAPLACVFLTPRPPALHIGKLAVARSARRQGHGTALIDLAAQRAKGQGLDFLELQTRIELVENHATFRAMGFDDIDRSAHPGYDRPTSITFRKPVR